MLDNYFYFDKISVLELFAGTGNISFEFASRGCLDITCVDLNSKCITWITRESERLGFDFIEAVKMDTLGYLKYFAAEGIDIIFADPPYEYRYYDEIHGQVFDKKLLNEKGWLIFEHDRNKKFDGYPYFSESRNYGQSMISIFKMSVEKNDKN